MIKKKFKIEGMHCSSCAMNIDFDLEDMEGVKKAQTSYAKQVSEVEFDEARVNPKNIIESIKKTGYKAIPEE
ncbi:MAG: heavy-metal-associated domain-containing protein [Candidatus Levyibacteriota bacterium]